MNFKEVKRKCAVRGCRNRTSVALSRVREFGESVLICRECLADAAEAVFPFEGEEPAAEENPANENPAGENEPEGVGYTCDVCNRVLGSKSALTQHKKTHEPS